MQAKALSTKEPTSNMTAGIVYGSTRNTHEFLFVIALSLSLLTLPFFRFNVGGYFMPTSTLVFAGYLYIRMLAFFMSRQVFRAKDRLLMLLMVLFVFFSLLSTSQSSYPNWRNLFEIAFYAIFVSFVTQSVRIMPSQARRVLSILALVVTLLSMAGDYNFIAGRSVDFRFASIGAAALGSRNVDIYTVIPGFAIALVFLATEKMKAWYLMSIAVILFSVFISFSRGGLFTVILVFLFVLFNIRKYGKKNIKEKLKASLMFVVIIMTCFYIYDEYNERVIKRFVYRYEHIEESSRIPVASEAFDLMLAHPVSGVGISNYRYFTEVGHKKLIATAHNSYLNFGAETGIFGFVTVILLFLYPYYRYMRIGPRLRRHRDWEKLRFLYVIGKTMSFYMIVINFFNIFYIDAGHIFWFYYALCFIVLYSLEDAISIRQHEGLGNKVF